MAAKAHLLIVDDEDGPRQSLRLIFKDDYEVLMATDGATAVELAQKHGRSLATAVEAALATTLKPVNGPLQSAFAEVTILYAPAPTRDGVHGPSRSM